MSDDRGGSSGPTGATGAGPGFTGASGGPTSGATGATGAAMNLFPWFDQPYLPARRPIQAPQIFEAALPPTPLHIPPGFSPAPPPWPETLPDPSKIPPLRKDPQSSMNCRWCAAPVGGDIDAWISG